VSGRPAAEAQQHRFESDANEWVARQRLIKETQEKGLTVVLPSTPNNTLGFNDFLEHHYLPWAKNHHDPRTMTARSSTILILVADLGNTPLVDVERRVDELVDKWRSEGCRFSCTVDRRGRTLNRKPRAISDAGLNERLKLLRAILGHAHMTAKILNVRPRIPLLKKKRAALEAGKMVRYFTPEERVRFLRYCTPGTGTDDVFQLGVLLGLRPDELFHAQVGWVELRLKKVMVQAGTCPHCLDGRWLPKTGRFRDIDICDDLLPILRRLTKGKSPSALLIPSDHGLPYWRRRGSGGRYSRTLRRAGLDRKGLSIYSLRHTFAADLVSAGKPLQEVAHLLGNSVRVCEMHYSHLRPGVTRETVKVLRAVHPWATPTEPRKARGREPEVAISSLTAGGDTNMAETTDESDAA
jgi:integrase